ncbi:hypothetical protein [Alteraurantiacibacter aquimixticola]|uniref:Thiamine biosynthesis protein ThiC n=1 Tax=Alteraurantiacibacter aquimixticola TaxID=2489173 RepID=A0A4T3F4U3_9SPHN|nr:hypothetical protein [Alteraurantiacibacter aquimixticola]TIX49733.1 hypothetical protein E5222_13040 [Alteraurantiacibacter aquimixticola]
MEMQNTRASQVVSAALILTVVTQIAYMALGASGQSHIAYPIWRTEALLGLVVAVAGFVIARRDALVGGCLVAGGIFNLIQTGMGLTLFYQLGYGGEGEPNPVFMPVLGFSFFLYFAAKAAFGIAAVELGRQLWRRAAGAWRIAGLLAAITGVAALLVNATAMAIGMRVVFPAGATGTVATFFLALCLLAKLPSEAD